MYSSNLKHIGIARSARSVSSMQLTAQILVRLSQSLRVGSRGSTFRDHKELSTNRSRTNSLGGV